MDKQTIILTQYDNNTHINFDHVLISSDNKFFVTWGNGIITKRDEWNTYKITEGKIKIFKLTTSSEKPTEIKFNETIQSGIADVKLSPDNKSLVVIMRSKDQLDMGNNTTMNAQAALIYDFNKITAQTSEEASGGRRQSRRHRRQSRRRRQTRKR